ncbi:hypothetical protein PspLS_03034 [Pyricularia sp. CBS 133598]|nr:hypothetical protein PspLS_03034 [Pyricularia sp. CBS 133598]
MPLFPATARDGKELRGLTACSKNWPLRQATSPAVPLSIWKEGSCKVIPRQHKGFGVFGEITGWNFDGDRVGAEKGGWLAKLVAG